MKSFRKIAFNDRLHDQHKYFASFLYLWDSINGKYVCKKQITAKKVPKMRNKVKENKKERKKT